MKINDFLRNINRLRENTLLPILKHFTKKEVEAVYIRQLRFDELINTFNDEIPDYVLICTYGLMVDNENIYTVDEINTIFTNTEIIGLAGLILQYTLNYNSMETINNFLYSDENKDVILNHFTLFKNHFTLAEYFDDLTFLQYLFFNRGSELFKIKMEEEYPELKDKKNSNNHRRGGFVKNSKLYKETNKA